MNLIKRLPLWFVLSCCNPVQAALVHADYSRQFDQTWQVNYQLTNNSLATEIREFSLYFDYHFVSNIRIVAVPDAWANNILLDNPVNNSGFAYDGLLDLLVTPGLPGISPSETLSGISIQFDWLTNDYLPSELPQYFEIIDTEDFSILESGYTQSVAVSSPSALMTFIAAVCALPLVRLLNVSCEKKHA